MKRSASWCSSYRRLFEKRDDLEPALNWASETEHKWAHCRSVERLLKLIAEYKRKTCAAPDKACRKRTARDDVATLEKRLSGCETTFIALCSALSQYWVVRARKLADADGDPREALVELALRIHSRASDPGETCSALQISRAVVVSPQPGEEDFLLDETLTREALQ